jgi:hypothetical protein
MRGHSTIGCQGRIRRAPSQPLTIDSLQLIQPIAETMLDGL